MGILFLIGVDVFMLFPPKIIGNIVSNLEINPDLNTVGFYLLGIVGVAFGMFLCRFLWRIFIIGAANKFHYVTKKELFNHLLSLSSKYYDQTKTGDLMAKFTNDVNAIRGAMGPAVVMSVDAVFLTALTIISMGIFVNWDLTLIGIIPLPIITAITLYFGITIHKRFRKVQDSFGELTNSTEESISGIRLIKSYGIEDIRYKILEKKSNDYVSKYMSLIKIFGMLFPLIMTIATSTTVISTYFGGSQVILNKISLGDYITYTGYLGMIVWPMIELGWVVNIIQRGRASYNRIMDVLNSKSEIKTHDKSKISKLEGNIKFDNLSYSYPGSREAVLKNINFEIEGGSKVAFVGTTGSGKSTLGKLISRMYAVEDQKIYIDNTDVNSIDPEIIRNNVSFVPQETFLFSETIKNNIKFGKMEATFENVVKYARVSSIDEDIQSFPGKYDSLVGEKGVTLSGGQKQRIAIARALIMETPIIILDDCLSAVDTETEAKILSSLKDSNSRKTVIIISHRLKAVMDADIIFVLDNGEIIERGTHNQLISNNKLYKKIYERQMLEEKLEEEES
ncbi:MAG: ATP-binding cassette, subfamily multidrug efflux pump [Kosmotogales bacterium]|nr:ATP-binding cassette, subfamily multidrug efflux pump [Kosmotogales bacterium]